jgi:uncharacterized protein
MTGLAGRSTRPLYFVGGIVSLAIGVVALMVPLVPGVFFLALASSCFARSSPRFEAWLVDHPYLGPAVQSWRKDGALTFRMKLFICGSMAAGYGLLWWETSYWPAHILALACIALGTAYVISRPRAGQGGRAPQTS